MVLDNLCDIVLKKLSERKNDFFTIDLLEIPKDAISSVIETLFANGHIEKEKFIGNEYYIKITDAGFNFIQNNSYEGKKELKRIGSITNVKTYKEDLPDLDLPAQNPMYHPIKEPIAPHKKNVAISILVWVMNNPMIAAIIGGIIAIVVGTIILKYYHIIN